MKINRLLPLCLALLCTAALRATDYVVDNETNLRVAGRISALRWTSVAGDVLPYLLSALLTTGLTWGLTEPLEQSPFWVLLPVRIVLAAVLYGALMWVRRDDIFLEMLRFLRR